MADGRVIQQDENAESTDPTLPAFLAPPKDAPVYHGFPLIPETETEGWVYGAITEFIEPGGCTDGDGYIVAPDGSRAGLVWEIGTEAVFEIAPPEPGRWGVYGICFSKPIFTLNDLVECFREVLPDLKSRYSEIQNGIQ